MLTDGNRRSKKEVKKVPKRKRTVNLLDEQMEPLEYFLAARHWSLSDLVSELLTQFYLFLKDKGLIGRNLSFLETEIVLEEFRQVIRTSQNKSAE